MQTTSEPDETPHWSEFHYADCPVLTAGRSLERGHSQFPDSHFDDAFSVLIEECFANNGASAETREEWCHYCHKGQPLTHRKIVTIEVLGGVAECTHAPADVYVEIIDHDNDATGEEASV